MAGVALGDTLRAERKYAAAAAAYQQVTEVNGADPELLQKADLGAGEMYDQIQNRDLALKKYQAVLAVDSDNAIADKARQRIKQAYRE
jgi:tetratricopeptide (TPR) repeat protein